MAKKIGLTGGIGCGKSTVGGFFELLGVEVINADHIAKDLTAENSPFLDKIVAKFGEHILSPDGSLDRREMGEIVFNNQRDRQWLERLLHPEIRRRMDDQAEQSIAPFIILEIPLLLESGRYKDMDKIIVVLCDVEIRRTRLIQSRKMSSQKVDAILATQASESERKEIADYLIDNNQDLDALVPQIETINSDLRNLYLN